MIEKPTRIESLVKATVIRDGCPCGNCVADSWIKIRAARFAIVPGLLAIGANAWVRAEGFLALVALILLVYLAAKAVARPINRHNERHGCVSDDSTVTGGTTDE